VIWPLSRAAAGDGHHDRQRDERDRALP